MSGPDLFDSLFLVCCVLLIGGLAVGDFIGTLEDATHSFFGVFGTFAAELPPDTKFS